MTKDKLTNLKNNIGSNSRVVTILWHQGENDIYRASDSIPNNSYISDINILFSNLRNDIKTIFPQSSSNVPVLLGGLCPDNYKNNNGTYNNLNQSKLMTNFIQSNVVQSIPNAYFVSAEPIAGSSGFTRDLEGDRGISGSDNQINENYHSIHFSADSQRELGKRYYSVFSTIT
jgi:hypothetical protein